jgi:HK97 family phage portal protein
MWRFRRKAAAAPASKSASFFLALGAGRSTLSGAAYNRLAQEGYAECVVAFACINKIAAAIASVEPQLYQRKGSKLARVESHDLLDLLENPNPAQSGMEFMLEMAAYHRLAGNAYVLGNGLTGQFTSKQPTELQLLSPGKIKVIPGKGFFPEAYEYRPDPSTTITYPVDQVSGRSAVLQLKSFNPLSPWTGLSPLSAAALSVDTHTGGQRWNKGLIENGARPSGALVVQTGDNKPATLTDEQYLRVKEMIDQQFSGPDNSGRPLLLEGGLDWKEMSLNPKDMDFLEGKHSAARDIALAFGVPPQLIGIPGDSTFANYEMAKLSFWTDTVIPLLCWYLSGFNRWLTPLYGKGLYLWYDEEMIPALEPLRKAKAERLERMNYISANEKRRAMGYDDFTQAKNPADDLYIESGKIPLALAGEAGLSEPGSGADQPDEEDENADG